MSASFDILPTENTRLDCKTLIEESIEKFQRFLKRNGIEKDFSVSALEFKHDGEEIHVPEYLTMDEDSYTVLIVNDVGEIYIFYHKVSDLDAECWNEDLLSNENAKLHEREIRKYLSTGYFWEVKKTMSQPPLVCLYYGFVSMVIANHSKGLVYSDDGAWDYSSMPMGFSEFELSYPDMNKVSSNELSENIRRWINALK